MSEEITTEHTQAESLQKKYKELVIPSPYDYLLVQEKLAAEIRKQNRELKTHFEVLKQMQANLNEMSESSQKISDQFEAFCDASDDDNTHNKSYCDETSTEDIVIQALDSIVHLVTATEETTKKLLSLLPTSTSFWRRSPPPWRCRVEELLDSYTVGVDTIQEKLLSLLDEIGIEPIIPEINSPFLPHLYRAVEQVSGGPSNCISKVLRYGIKKSGTTMRFADVVVFK